MGENVAKMIKEIRLSKGMTQSQFGALFNASKGNVSSWENGTCLPNPMRYRMILQLSTLDINLNEMIIEAGKIDLSRVDTKDLLKELERRTK